MKEIKKEIVTEQVVYEITKEELEKIKRDERNKGRYDIMNYLKFSIGNYCYEINLAGMRNLIGNICDFVTGNTNNIENTYGYNFSEYVRKYRE